MDFKLKADYQPTGDQPQAIATLVDSIQKGNPYQTLVGVTGSGKTFTMANVIGQVQQPTLVISHNKTLAAQLYSEFKNFFPENAVEYFVSYYDYYQPEAYLPQTDTFIEKDASINDEIERLRISAMSALMTRQDVIVVASVSCIYGLGSPQDFKSMMIPIQVGTNWRRETLLERLVESLYERNDVQFTRGKFRVRGESIDIFPVYREEAIRIEFWGDCIDSIVTLDPLTGLTRASLDLFYLYPANPYITPRDKLKRALTLIREELEQRVAWFEKEGRLLEAQRIRIRTEYDLELLQEMGFCSGIENYSRHLSNRKSGERPYCLIDFFPKEFLLVIDESHVTLPQIGGMYCGDRSRKERLVEYGFRLPSALDNRPLRAEEFTAISPTTLYVSATPGKHEQTASTTTAEQLIRPTGLLDPTIERYPIKGQVEHFIGEAHKAIAAGERVLVTTLTKRMSEDLAAYLREAQIRIEYLHSDIDALERVEILRNLRQGTFDVLVGVNLLREGLDLPEVALVGILDADKEGFLRSETSLIQTAGRAARHEKGRVILYADRTTEAIRRCLEITHHRREKQMAYNQAHHIIPKSVRRKEQVSLHHYGTPSDDASLTVVEAEGDTDRAAVIAELETEMLAAADKLEFERAAVLRDQIDTLKKGHVRKVKPVRKKQKSRKSTHR